MNKDNEKTNEKKYKVNNEFLTESEFIKLKEKCKGKYLIQFVKRESDNIEIYSKQKIFLS